MISIDLLLVLALHYLCAFGPVFSGKVSLRLRYLFALLVLRDCVVFQDSTYSVTDLGRIHLCVCAFEYKRLCHQTLAFLATPKMS